MKAFYMKYFILLFIIYIFSSVECQSLSDDKRCKCICPKVSIVTNNTEIVDGERIRYVANVPPNKCNCMAVVIPKIASQLNGKEGEFCPRCECKYENRNTTIIKVVVIIVIWIISVLVIYMAFLIILDPLLNKRMKGSYQEHTNEDKRRRYKRPKINDDDELLNLLENSDNDMIENEDTLEMVYLPLEDFKQNDSDDKSDDIELLDISEIDRNFSKNDISIAIPKNKQLKGIVLTADSGIEEISDSESSVENHENYKKVPEICYLDKEIKSNVELL